MGSRHLRHGSLNDITGVGQQRSRQPSVYPPEGEPADVCPRCGARRIWSYGYKRRRPSVRCLDCQPFLKT